MPAGPYQPGPPDSQEVKIIFPDAEGIVLDRWTNYSFKSDFLTPADSFHFNLGLDENGLPEPAKEALCFGARIQLMCDQRVLANGHVDIFDTAADRSSGHVVTITGRDRLGQVLDTTADPTYQLKEGGTLADLLHDLFKPFGFSESDFVLDPEADRNAKTGIRGTPTTRGGKKKGPQPLKSFVLHQTKPYNHESVWHFANRVTQRHGLWIRLSADGAQILVTQPNYDQAPAYSLLRTRDYTNVLQGSRLTVDMTDQPTMIIADSFGGGAEYGKGRFRAYCVNPLLGFDEDGNVLPEVAEVLKKYPSAYELTIPRTTFYRRAKNLAPRVMYLHDDESKTQLQLNAFVLREMSLLLRKAIRGKYVVEGHGQMTENGFVGFAYDTIAHVRDDAAGFDDDMWVLGVTYDKSRGGTGTTTTLDLIMKDSLHF